MICLVGDGGAQFTLSEMMVAVDERLPIRFVVWNNLDYGEIASAMEGAGFGAIGCDPTPPAFDAVAASFGVAYHRMPARSARRSWRRRGPGRR